MSPSVAVVGGGVGGLSAAHHLAERGFDVTVYEAADRPGGKARSVAVPGTGEPGLPGEHGFRFFPGFYEHVVDTMASIPDGAGTVADNLVPTERTLVASVHGEDHLAATETPATPRAWLDALAPGRGADVPRREAAFFAERMLELLTSCEQRRREELDRRTWWEFLDAGRMSRDYRELVRSTQSLVALRPDRASARTVGRIYVQLLRGTLDPAMEAERILDGPTSERWIDPWVAHLASLGVDVVTGARATGFEVESGAVTGVTVVEEGRGGAAASPERVGADYYVAAVPVEVMAALLDGDLRAAAPELRGVEQLDTAWMNGVQFYLREDVPLVAGHQVYADAPWALTAISQAQFWDVDLRERSAGEVEGVLSVIVSDWNTPGIVHDRPARECTPREIAEEVWAQVRAHLDDSQVGGDGRTEDAATVADRLEEAVAGWFLDPAIVEAEDGRGVDNRAPLLVNTVGSLRHRPPADPGVENLYLAADYVRTGTDLASMEAADEAARRAVRAILADSGIDAAAPELWQLREPPVFAPARAHDRVRYRLGLPHPGTVSRSLQGALRDARPPPGVRGLQRWLP